MVEIKLSLAEIQVASMVGVQRQLNYLKHSKGPVFGERPETAWQRHIEGALSECALAKHLGVYWNNQAWHLPDVGEVDVRVTSHEQGRLIIHDKDLDNKKYYFLIGVNGHYKVMGWIWGKDGKQQKYWGDPQGTGRPAYFISMADLNDGPKKEKHWLDD